MIFTGIVMLIGNIIIYGTPLLLLYGFISIIYSSIIKLFIVEPMPAQKPRTASSPRRRSIRKRYYKNVRHTIGKCDPL